MTATVWKAKKPRNLNQPPGGARRSPSSLLGVGNAVLRRFMMFLREARSLRAMLLLRRFVVWQRRSLSYASAMHYKRKRFAHARSALVWLWLTAVATSSSMADVGEFFLWKGLGTPDNTFYLFGSLHYVPPSCYPLSQDVEAAYASATAIGVEVDVSSAETAVIAEVLGRYPKGGRLDRDVPRALLAQVQAVAKRHGWNWNRLLKVRPWVVAGMIAAADFEANGYPREMGMDLYFTRAAKRDEKLVVELESVREQFDTFNRMPLDWQIFMLRDSISAVQSGANADTLAQLVDAWKRGDVGRFQELTEASLADAPRHEALASALYHQRNAKMAERIERLVKQGHRVFVVVGAAHLAGPRSLVEILRDRGFSIERVRAGSQPSIAE